MLTVRFPLAQQLHLHVSWNLVELLWSYNFEIRIFIWLGCTRQAETKLGLDALAVEALLLRVDTDRDVDLEAGKSGCHLITKASGAIGRELELLEKMVFSISQRGNYLRTMPKTLRGLPGRLESEALARHPEVYSQQESVILQVPACRRAVLADRHPSYRYCTFSVFCLLYFDVQLNTCFYAWLRIIVFLWVFFSCGRRKGRKRGDGW